MTNFIYLLSLEVESDRRGGQSEAVSEVKTSAGGLNVPDDVVTSESTLEGELQVGRGSRRGRGADVSLGAESFLDGNAGGRGLDVVGLFSIGAEDGVELRDDGPDGEVMAVVV